MNTKKLKAARRTVLYIFLIFLAVACIYPVFWIIMTSFKTSDEQLINGPFALSISLYLGIIVTAITIVLIVFLAAPAAFAIEKMRFKFSNAMLGFFLLGITIPIHITLIPLFQIYKQMGILNTYLSLILPQVAFALSMSIYLFTAFFKYLPDSLMEAAVIDGASVNKCFTSIFLPLSKNTIVTVVTMNLIGVWNEFVFSNTLASSRLMKTLPVGLYDYVGEKGKVDWGATFSAISISLIPVLILYFVLNKNIIEGMTAGAIKE